MSLTANQKQATLVASLFFVIGFLIYGYSVVNNQFVEFDDTLLIIDNLSVIQAGRLSSILWAFGHYDPELYIPLTFLSFQFDAVIAGLNPIMFHLDNLVQHIANALLITWILKLLCKRIDVAIVLGLLFLVHPLNTEAVAWASGRKDLFSTLFFLSSIVTYLRRQGVASIILFILGLLAKVTVAPLPVALLLIDWLQDRDIQMRQLWSKKWYFVAAVVFGLIALLGKDQVLARSSTESVLLLIPRTIVFYAEKLLLPINLSILYPFKQSAVSLATFEITASLLFILCIAGFVYWKRKTYPMVSLGLGITFIVLVPSFFQYYRGSELYLASDRYMYMPFIGVLIALIPLCSFLIDRWKHGAYAMFSMILIVLSYLSLQRSHVWENTYTLFSDSLQHAETFGAYEKIGAWQLRQGNREEAIAALTRSIELSPNSAAYFRLGVAAMEMGNTADAKLLNQEALALSPENPQAHINMSKLYWDEGNRQKALEHAKLAHEYHPWNEMALGNLATMYTLTNQREQALEIIYQFMDIYPNNPRMEPLLRKLQ